ncbi:methyltransferase domain-containing protein [Micromonospora sp. WMMD1155]|uniref:class I SAM-dependent methyltransferase n=1 Tax=Micromonospora sp. WMMD1155 TaxID=3016094 RepID=UPI00249B9FAE|nr:methyltransferase domain-containing protein [Micromonospora sp. WMMD1155]WFE55232.1 methyltransferase domain-containing protein [Micromonospora sp. WMMD1155]
MVDPIILAELTRIDLMTGQTVLDVGGGTGSTARHLCDRVGRSGKVISVDADLPTLDPTGVLDVFQRDLRTQQLPVQTASLHVVVARCVLAHLPNRQQLLHNLITALRPGGHLALVDIVTAPVAVYAPTDADSVFINHVIRTILDGLTVQGVDLNWGHSSASLLLGNGFERVHTRWLADTWAGGTAGCQLYAEHATQLADYLLSEGLSPEDLERFGELMGDPSVLVRAYQFASTTARKPPQPPVT